MKIKEIIEQLFQNKGKDICLPTGFYYFDKFLDGGLFRKELIIIGGGSGCLAKGTLILMSDGKRKKIEDIKKGESVLSFDSYSKKTVPNTVDDVFRTCTKPKPMISLTNDKETITITYDHPFYNGEGFYPLYQLIWGEMETSQRTQLKLLCKQYGATFDYKKKWGKHSCCNETCPRCLRLFKNSNEWKDSESSSNSCKKLVRESIKTSLYKSYRWTKRQQQSGEFRVVYSKIQCLDWFKNGKDKVSKYPYSENNKITEERDKRVLSKKYDLFDATFKTKTLRQTSKNISPDNKNKNKGNSNWEIKILPSAPYYSLCLQKAPYTYYIGKEHNFITHNTGKSYIAGTIFRHVASQGYRSAYFSLEISNAMVSARFIAQDTGIKFSRILYGLLTPDEVKKVEESKIKLQVWEDQMDFYDDIYEYDKLEEEIRKNKYDFVVVDFIQNIIAKAKDEYSALSQISLRLQKLAKECNCCILALSQLSNSVNRSGGEIAEFKGSSSIMNVCDLGIFILRKSNSQSLVNDEFVLKVIKNRRGVSGPEFNFKFLQPGGQIIEIKNE